MKKVLSGILCIAMCLGLCACGGEKSGGETLTWQEQYDLGLRYLSEGNYEEAILAFTAAIEIDAKQARAYVGRGDAYMGAALLAMPEGTDLNAVDPEGEALGACQNAAADYAAAVELDATMAEVYQKAAEVYVILGDTDAAIAILQKGVEATGDQSLSDALARLEQGKDPENEELQESEEPQGSAEPQESAEPQGSEEPQESAEPQGEEPTPDSSDSSETGPEVTAQTIDFDPVALLGQNISVITDKYGEPTEDMGTIWRWCAEDLSYDFMIELFDDKTIRSVNCGWGAPAILGVKAGDSAEAAKAALSTVGEVLTRDAGNGQTNYFTNTWGEPTYDFAVMDGSVVYVSVYAFVEG